MFPGSINLKESRGRAHYMCVRNSAVGVIKFRMAGGCNRAGWLINSGARDADAPDNWSRRDQYGSHFNRHQYPRAHEHHNAERIPS